MFFQLCNAYSMRLHIRTNYFSESVQHVFTMCYWLTLFLVLLGPLPEPAASRDSDEKVTMFLFLLDV